MMLWTALANAYGNTPLLHSLELGGNRKKLADVLASGELNLTREVMEAILYQAQAVHRSYASESGHRPAAASRGLTVSDAAKGVTPERPVSMQMPQPGQGELQ